MPVLARHSQATRPLGSSARTASRTPSEIWSQTLSGCPSVTDSEVNRYSLSDSSRALIGSVLLPGREHELGAKLIVLVGDGEADRMDPGDVVAQGCVQGILRQARLLREAQQLIEVEEE